MAEKGGKEKLTGNGGKRSGEAGKGERKRRRKYMVHWITMCMW